MSHSEQNKWESRNHVRQRKTEATAQKENISGTFEEGKSVWPDRRKRTERGDTDWKGKGPCVTL